MTQDNDEASNRFLPRIREELDKLPLTDHEREQVLPKLAAQAAFLDRGHDTQGSRKLSPDSSYFDFQSKLVGVVDRFADEGLTLDCYIAVALKQPQLFGRSPATIEKNIRDVVDRFADNGLTVDSYLKAALKQPQLFYQSPDTVEERIRAVVDRFREHSLTTKAYLQAALKHPSLFGRSPATIERNISDVVDRFADNGLTVDSYLKAALKHPQLFGRSPATIEQNIRDVADRFADNGLTVDSYLKAALDRPQLFSLSPITIERNISAVAECFVKDGLILKDYLRAALKQPTLFCQSPETISRHIEAVYRLFDDGVFIPPRSNINGDEPPTNAPRYEPVLDFLMKNPYVMCLADDNFTMRDVHQRMTDGPTDTNLLRRPRHAVQRELMRHLGHDDPKAQVPNDGFVAGQANPSEEQAKRFVLRSLMRTGLIKGGNMER